MPRGATVAVDYPPEHCRTRGVQVRHEYDRVEARTSRGLRDRHDLCLCSRSDLKNLAIIISSREHDNSLATAIAIKIDGSELR